MIAPRVTNHLPPFGGKLFPDLQGASSSYHEKNLKRLDHGFLDHFLFGVELLLFICFAALLRAFSFVQSHHHLRSAFFWRSGGVRSLPYLLGTEVGGSSKVR